MRVLRVTALAFGPFDRGASLSFAPGLSIVVGPNEAGKSSWHAALRVGLCGLRRGSGLRAEDRDFALRHRPWDDPEGDWRVSVLVELDDGRTVELVQDLAGRIQSSAIDAMTGVRYDHEILDEGSPDASVWLGLRRDAFAATLSIDQAAMLGILDSAGSLERYLQRAAASGAPDATTAAAAIQTIRSVRSERIGTGYANSTKALRRAVLARDAAGQALSAARAAHARYLALAQEANEARDRHARAARALALASAARELRLAAIEEERLARARELAARHPAAPAPLPERDAEEEAVAAALAGWESLPVLVDLAGQSAADIEAEMARLPEAPAGDLRPDASVVAAHTELVRARARLDALGERPPVPAAPPVGGAGPEELERLAAELEVPDPAPDASRESEAAGLDASAALLRGRVRPVRAAACVVVGVALVAYVAVGPVAGLAAAVAALGLFLAGERSARLAASAAARAVERRRPDEARRAAAEARRQEARARAVVVGVPASAAGLRSLARDARGHEEGAARAAAWDEEHRALSASEIGAAEQLATALRARHAEPDDDPELGYAGYVEACAARARQATEAASRAGLEQALANRRRVEAEATAVAARRQAAAARLRDIAEAIGVDAADDAGRLAGLRSWRAARAVERAGLEAAIREWAELEAILGAGSLADLEAQAMRRAEAATAAMSGLAAAEVALAAADLGGDPDARLRALADVEREAADAAHRLEGNLEAAASATPDVVAAEEAFGRAEADLAAVNRFAQVLADAEALLGAAQGSVHRDIALALGRVLERDLLAVTAGRYTSARVNPQSLAVSVREAATDAWRDAQLLSEGTREQIYLLLRAAMAQHLVTTRETAPLLLDEATAQCDEERTIRVLETLQRLAHERQVILFSHGADVAAWARANLEPERDCLVELAPRGPARAS